VNWLSGWPSTVWLFRRATDMRKSYDGLSALAKNVLGEDPLGGAVFCFVNRRRTQMKCLYFDGDGFCVWAKRLEKGRFQVRFDGADKARIDADTLKFIIDGVDPRSVRRYKRYRYSRGDLRVVP
jgi:transposase